MKNEVYIINEYGMSNHNDRHLGVHSVHINPKSVLVMYSEATLGKDEFINIQSIENCELFYQDNSYFQITKQPLLEMS